MSEAYADNRPCGRPPKYPFSRMEIGEKCFITTIDAKRVYSRVQDHAPRRFKCRQMMVKGQQGTMVWRIA